MQRRMQKRSRRKKRNSCRSGAESPYVNIVTVKAGNENNDKIKALVKALKSDKIKNFIAETYPNGEVVLVF